MKLDFKILMFLLAVLIAGEFYFIGRDSARTKTLLDQISNAYSTSLELEKEIGYGGLIHNFKNYILRPDETDYRDKADANAVNALVLIDTLESDARALRMDLRLTHTRAVVQSYQKNIPVVADLIERGVSIVEIDAQVRINDAPALREISGAAELTAVAVNERLERLRLVSQIRLALVFTLVSGGIVYVILTTRKMRQQSVEIQNTNITLKSANEKLGRVNAELGRSNSDLERSNTAMRQFAGIAAHDLRSPVRQIALMADMMPKDGEDPSKITYFADEIRSAAIRLDRLVASLLDFTKTGFQQPRLQRVDPYLLIEDVIRDLAAPIESLKASIHTANLPQVNADPELLKRVFQNLIENALRYAHTDRAPEISITATGNSQATVFSVADNGIGIDPEQAERIFLPMQRLHDRHEKYDGVGIGLSLVKSIVEAHGGAVWLDTECGSGARICFTLSAASRGKDA